MSLRDNAELCHPLVYLLRDIPTLAPFVSAALEVDFFLEIRSQLRSEGFVRCSIIRRWKSSSPGALAEGSE